MPDTILNICSDGAEETTKDNSESDSGSENEEDEAVKEDVILRASVVKKIAQSSEKSQTRQSSDNIYEFVAPIGDEQTKSNKDENESSISYKYDDDDGCYVEMKTKPAIDGSGQLQEVTLRQREDESGGIYSNVEIRNVQSMNTITHSKDTPELYLPKRSASESYVHSDRPPIPQPRVSKKKKLELYDIVPEIPNRVPINNTLLDIKSDTANNHVQPEEQSPDAGGISDTLEPEETTDSDSAEQYSDTDDNVEDNIYDYPRNNSKVIHNEDLEEEAIYKVPPPVNT